MRYLITGVKGQLGYDLTRELDERGETDYLAVDIAEMDITDKDQVMKVITEYRPDVIFHCAAYTAVDKAEQDVETCYKVNVEGTKNITDASLAVGAKLVYLSTDYVFDGTKEGYYTEEDQVNPQSVYGKTKQLGEEEVKRNPNHFIGRISWVFGINGSNFIKTMLGVSENLEKLGKPDEVSVVMDQIGSPTYTVDLSKVLVKMVQTDKYGTYNITNEGFCTWAEFTEYFYAINNRATKVNAVTTPEYYGAKPHAPRPENSKMSKDKLEENGFDRLPTWQDATDRYCKELVKKR